LSPPDRLDETAADLDRERWPLPGEVSVQVQEPLADLTCPTVGGSDATTQRRRWRAGRGGRRGRGAGSHLSGAL